MAEEETSVPRRRSFLVPKRPCHFPDKNMKKPSENNTEDITPPRLPPPIPNLTPQKGAITPGKPNIKLPGRKTIREQPRRVKALLLAKVLEAILNTYVTAWQAHTV